MRTTNDDEACVKEISDRVLASPVSPRATLGAHSLAVRPTCELGQRGRIGFQRCGHGTQSSLCLRPGGNSCVSAGPASLCTKCVDTAGCTSTQQQPAWPWAFPTPYTRPANAGNAALDTRKSLSQSPLAGCSAAVKYTQGGPSSYLRQSGCTCAIAGPRGGCKGSCIGAGEAIGTVRLENDVREVRELLDSMKVEDAVWGARAGAPECRSPIGHLSRVAAYPLP